MLGGVWDFFDLMCQYFHVLLENRNETQVSQSFLATKISRRCPLASLGVSLYNLSMYFLLFLPYAAME